MRNLLVFLHLAAAILWVGGMAFVLMALRPAVAAQLPPPQRLPLMVQVLRRFFAVVVACIAVLLATGVPLLVQVLRRFFAVVVACIAVLLATGVPLLVQVPGAQAPLGWHAMAALGIAMMLVFGHIFFAPWRRTQRAVAAQDWPEGGKRLNQIATLVKVNLLLGFFAIAAVLLWR